MSGAVRHSVTASGFLRGFGRNTTSTPARTADGRRAGKLRLLRLRPGNHDPREFENLRITALAGTLAWMGSSPSIHAHARGAGSRF
jgi:hypothetical protein